MNQLSPILLPQGEDFQLPTQIVASVKQSVRLLTLAGSIAGNTLATAFPLVLPFVTYTCQTRFEMVGFQLAYSFVKDAADTEFGAIAFGFLDRQVSQAVQLNQASNLFGIVTNSIANTNDGTLSIAFEKPVEFEANSVFALFGACENLATNSLAATVNVFGR